MIVIPAIDLKDGACVRLLQGRADAVTVYSPDPVATARHWESLGAEVLHIVDLDGAFTGSQKNLEAIIKIREAVGLAIEVGGGIRDIRKVAELVMLGIDRVILGTAAVTDPDFLKEACQKYHGKILVGIDARSGKVAVQGWVEITPVDAFEFARSAEKDGASGIIYTDIAKDGMMTGPNTPAVADMVNAVKIPVIASGGISSLQDIRHLIEIPGLWGAITGKAIYSGMLNLQEAITLSREKAPVR